MQPKELEVYDEREESLKAQTCTKDDSGSINIGGIKITLQLENVIKIYLKWYNKVLYGVKSTYYIHIYRQISFKPINAGVKCIH